ncbi:MAG: tRNA (adenosine(37)-N6)-threonylcarbamoyltransferase complex dimerization subunit type 1 TsaB [Clostridiales bacterium]|nr:tRNA (adenosine(37)-N6)-threonylcarbamoyltransferase complex dimerization subunit type 1 TsaB [Clostridiales bacterium]
MKLLCCDTSNRTCCAGAYEDGRELAYEISFEKKTHSETFMPLVERVLNEAKLKPSDIDAYAVTTGPGSFTGIRIGLSAVKGMALATRRRVIPVSSLKALAMSVENVAADPSDTIIVPCFDARNDRIFAAAIDDETGNCLIPDGAYFNQDFTDRLSKLPGASEKQIIVVGDGADVVGKALFFTHRVNYAPGAVILPKGIMSASIGVEPVDGAAIKATYCAVSRAERYQGGA